jgi:two-component sensor histidine kinase
MDNPQTLGLEFVAALAHQIEGTIEINSTKRLKYTVSFKI